MYTDNQEWPHPALSMLNDLWFQTLCSAAVPVKHQRHSHAQNVMNEHQQQKFRWNKSRLQHNAFPHSVCVCLCRARVCRTTAHSSPVQKSLLCIHQRGLAAPQLLTADSPAAAFSPHLSSLIKAVIFQCRGHEITVPLDLKPSPDLMAEYTITG